VGKPIEEMEVPSNATINQNRLDRMRTRLTGCLQTPSTNEQERALLSEILQRVGQEQGSTPEQLALAALELSLAGKPLLLQSEENFHQVRQNGPGRDGGRDGGRDFGRDRGRGREMGRDADRGPRGERPMGPPEDHMERFRVEVGWRDRIKPGNIVGAIANEAGLNGRSIGRIQIFDTHSTVDLPKGMPDEVFQGLRQLRVMNKALQISRLQG
jgi:ATP-dependent RNA helicase DeaD